MHIDFWKLNLENQHINAWFGGIYDSFFRALKRSGAKVTLSMTAPDSKADVLVVPIGGGQDRLAAQAMSDFQGPTILYVPPGQSWFRREYIDRWREYILFAYSTDFSNLSPRLYKTIGIDYHCFPFASDPSVMRPLDDIPKLYDVVFVGNPGSGTGRHKYFEALMKRASEIKIQLIGPGWERYGYPFRSVAWGNLLNQIYNTARVCVNVLNDEQKLERNQLDANHRLFDLAMAGCLQVCNAPQVVREYFDETEVPASDNPEEWVSKILHYLEHPAETHERQIAARRRALAEHTWEHRATMFMELIGSSLNNWNKKPQLKSFGLSIGRYRDAALPPYVSFRQTYMNQNISEKMVIGVIFSKDRAMQLDGVLRSLLDHCKDGPSIRLKVIYKASSQRHEQHYQQLKRIYEPIEFLREKDFKQDLVSSISSFQYILFLVDDNIFVRNFRLKDVTDHLGKHPDAIGFSLRLGRNTDYCYMFDRMQNIPMLTALNDNIMKYDWRTAEYDFGYPLEVSSSVYRVSDLLPLLNDFQFSNPNTLEFMLDSNKDFYRKMSPKLLCYDHSVTFCNPANVVQTLWKNKASDVTENSSEWLADKFNKGYRIRIEKFSNFTPNACHQEVELEFIKSEPLVSIVILNYNGLEDVSTCLDSIRRHTPEPYEIIVVDDASSDGSVAFLQMVPDIILLKNRDNLGCPGSRSRGFSLAKGKYVVSLDNDTIVTPGWLTSFIEHAANNPKVGMFGPRSNYVSGPQLVKDALYRDARELDAYAKKFCEHNKGRITKAIRLVGFCQFIKREVIERIGVTDGNLGFAFDDDDYTIRASIAGFDAAIVHDVFIHHTGGPQGRGDRKYNSQMLEDWDVFKRKWNIPKDIKYGAYYDRARILSQPFDPDKHYIPLIDLKQLDPLIVKSEAEKDANHEVYVEKSVAIEQAYKDIDKLVEAGSYRKAILQLNKLLASFPDCANAHYDVGGLYQKERKLEKALNHYTQAVELEPEKVVYRKTLADFNYIEMRETGKAYDEYQKILSVEPENLETLLISGNIAVVLSRFDDAIKLYERVLKIEPGNLDVMKNFKMLQNVEKRESGPSLVNIRRKFKNMILCFTSNPTTTAACFERAFRLKHNVLTVGAKLPQSVIEVWNLQNLKEEVKAHDISTPNLTVNIDYMLERVPKNFNYDFFLWIETGLGRVPERLDRISVPKAAYLIDTHLKLQLHLDMAKEFDVVFLAQRDYISEFKKAGNRNVYWLPLACDPGIHGRLPVQKEYDVGFVGSMTDERRMALLGTLSKVVSVRYKRAFLREMTDHFCRSRIVFNNAIRKDLNMRVFEGMCSGSMMLTDYADGIDEFFRDRKHLVIYDDNNLVDVARYYLSHDSEREKIAEAGRLEVLEKHTYVHRAEEMVRVMEGLFA
jgi:GT2 family glycosyltransferase/spore maturation protein CgeB/Tfp pilus assembly protein PilF